MRKKAPAITAEWQKFQKEREKAEENGLMISHQYRHGASDSSPTSWHLVRVLWTLVTIALSIFLAISLYSYNPADPGFSVTGSTNVQNIAGIAGAYFSDLLYWLFGYSAWWLVLCFIALFVKSVCVLVTKKNDDSVLTGLIIGLVGVVVLLISSTTIEALQFSYLVNKLPLEAGGLLGDEIAKSLTPFLGIWMETFLFLLLGGFSVSCVFGFSWINGFEKIGYCLEVVFLWFKKHLKRDHSREQIVKPKNENSTSDEPMMKPSEVAVVIQQQRTTNPSYKEIGARQPTLFGMEEKDERLLPSVDLLDIPTIRQEGITDDAIRVTSRLIESKLKTYRVEAQVVGAQAGPVITQYHLQLADGVKGSHVEDICKDLTRALAVHSVRVVPVIPGKPYMGLEIPNDPKQRMAVYLRELIGSEDFEKSRSLLSLALGKDIAGRPVILDLARMPHILVGGTTGSGKSVAINTMILSLLFKCDPSQLRLVLIDPKFVEFSLYQNIPHLLCPVVTDMNKAANALMWLVQEMDHRYSLMSRFGVRSFDTFNEKIRAAQKAGSPIMDPFDVTPENPEPHTPLTPLPYIVCFIDELADLILVNRKQVESHIMRLAQKARAAGMHLVLATQRPSADIVTPVIKTNIVARMCFQVASRYDSQVVLDTIGAQDLLGRGDMLLKKPSEKMLMRVQGCMVQENEVIRVCEDLRSRGEVQYVEGVTEENISEGNASGGLASQSGSSEDPLYDKAVELVLENRRPTISFVERRLNIGYNRAANLIEAMERNGVISQANGAGKREILVRDGVL